MAIGNPLEIFQWGQGGQKLSPQQVAEQRRVAQALAARGGAPKNVGEGLNRIGEALMYRSLTGRADEAEAAGRATANQAFESIFGTSDPVDVASGGVREGSPTIQELFGLVGNEWASPQQQSVAQALLNQQLQQQDPMYQANLAAANQALERGNFQAQPMSPEDMAAWGIPEGTGSWTIGPDGTPQQIFAPQESSTDLPTSVQEYEYYVQQAAALGEQPVPYVEWDNARKAAGAVNVDARNMGSIPPGYAVEYDESGNPISMSPIPGGPAAAEQLAAEQAAQAGAEQSSRYGSVVIEDIDRAVEAIESDPVLTTGIIGQWSSQIGGTPANRVNNLLQTVKANAGFDRLQAMRESSPTGGALGAVSERELDLLNSAIGSLEQSNNAEDLIYNLRRVQGIYDEIINGPQSSRPNQSQANPSVVNGTTGGGVQWRIVE